MQARESSQMSGLGRISWLHPSRFSGASTDRPSTALGGSPVPRALPRFLARGTRASAPGGLVRRGATAEAWWPLGPRERPELPAGSAARGETANGP